MKKRYLVEARALRVGSRMDQVQKKTTEREARRSRRSPEGLRLGVCLRNIRLSSTRVMECYKDSLLELRDFLGLVHRTSPFLFDRKLLVSYQTKSPSGQDAHDLERKLLVS